MSLVPKHPFLLAFRILPVLWPVMTVHPQLFASLPCKKKTNITLRYCTCTLRGVGFSYVGETNCSKGTLHVTVLIEKIWTTCTRLTNITYAGRSPCLHTCTYRFALYSNFDNLSKNVTAKLQTFPRPNIYSVHVAVSRDYFLLNHFHPGFESSVKTQLLELLPYMVTGKQNNWLTG